MSIAVDTDVYVGGARSPSSSDRQTRTGGKSCTHASAQPTPRGGGGSTCATPGTQGFFMECSAARLGCTATSSEEYQQQAGRDTAHRIRIAAQHLAQAGTDDRVAEGAEGNEEDGGLN